MNVRLIPRGHPERSLLYGGIVRVESDGALLHLFEALDGHDVDTHAVPLAQVAEIALDDEPGDWW